MHKKMKAIKFSISGDFACFKRPHQNNKTFTYGNIHKVALLGALGSIVGYGGYTQKNKDADYPEFYEKLKDFKIAIKPNVKGIFSKKFMQYVDSTGFSNAGEGLMIHEQVLINPSWDIYILLENENNEMLKDIQITLSSNKACYLPYLGKNTYPANITNYEIVEVEEISKVVTIHSLCEIDKILFDDEIKDNIDDCYNSFSICEIMPIGMTKGNNRYIEKELCYTDYLIQGNALENLYKHEEYNLQFI